MKIYADNAATTRVDEEVLQAMMLYFTQDFGNPSSIYEMGRNAQKTINEARKQLAEIINCDAGELFYTSGGTESINWAIKSVAKKYAKKGKHIITSKIEHHAVLHSLESLVKDGFEVTYLDVDNMGFISLDELEKSIRKDTILITVMTANNEIGTIQPVEQIGEIAKKHGVLFHTDAVQAFGHIEIDVKKMNIDLLSISGHKFNAPKGIGALYMRKGLYLPAYLDGGGQENHRRSGTENVAFIVGMSLAAKKASERMKENNDHLNKLKERLIDGILSNIPYSRLNSPREKVLSGVTNFSIEFIEGESLLLMLDLRGICASSGSACTSGSLDPSHVLLAIGLIHEVAHGSLRISFDHSNTMEDVEQILKILPEVVSRLREMSPTWEKIEKN